MEALRRKIKILFVISRRRHETMENLAQEFGVSIRTIRRDIAFLIEELFPIYTVQGKYGGGVYAMDDWYLGTVYLNTEQENFLIRLLGEYSGKDLEIVKSMLYTFSHPKSIAVKAVTV